MDGLQIDEATGKIVFTAKLKRQPHDSADDTSYDQWIKAWTLILQARGPKW